MRERRDFKYLAPTSLRRKRHRFFSSSFALNSSFLISFSCVELIMCLMKCLTGKQAPQVLGFYVESSLMGHGVCCHYGHCFGKWRGETLFQLSLSLSLSNGDCRIFFVSGGIKNLNYIILNTHQYPLTNLQKKL